MWRFKKSEIEAHIRGKGLEKEEKRVVRHSRLHGENNPNARLTAEQVRWIRHLYQTGELVQAAAARRYNVSPTAISRIVKGRTYL